MKVTFLGHNGWFLDGGSSCAMLDPVFVDGSGTGPEGGRIFPPTKVYPKGIPAIEAVFISHEHTDHFHLPTLNLLPRSVKIIVGPLMPDFVLRVVRSMGFSNIQVQPFGQPLNVGKLDITLYNGASNTAIWEKRVTQYYVRSAESSEAIYFCVDAQLCPRFKRDLAMGSIIHPVALAISNNSEIPHRDAISTLDDCRLERRLRRSSLIGIKILREVLVSYCEGLESIPYILIVGGGFVKEGYLPGPRPFRDQAELAAIANEFSRGDVSTRAVGPKPGQSLSFRAGDLTQSFESWIEVDREKLLEIHQSSEHFTPTNSLVRISAPSEKSVESYLEVVEQILPEFAISWNMSPQGREAFRYLIDHESNFGTVGLILRFMISEIRSIQFSLDVRDGTFSRDDDSGSVPEFERSPVGLIMHLVDFVAVCTGELQIWDVANGGMQSWYEGDNPFLSPIAFLYVFLGEQLRPTAAEKSLELAYGRICQEASK